MHNQILISFTLTYLSKRSFHYGKPNSFIKIEGLSLLPTPALCLRFCTIAIRLLFAILKETESYSGFKQ
ncbi:hypothetical protein Hanom_Chr09g00765351 [Helianthus anomalus]